MKHHKDRTRGEKEERFEERMGKQVKHGRLIRGETNCHYHVAQLRNGGIRQNPLDVVLLCCD